MARQPVQVRRPEKETGPAVHYLGAHQATLDPLAARRPDGDLFAWATQGPPHPQRVTAGHPGQPTSSAAALLSYDVPHLAPWDWRVSLYTWTKSIAAGAFVVPVLLALTGYLHVARTPLLMWAAPILALAFLGADRRRPDRRPEAPPALLPDLHPPSVAELARPRRVHHRRLRRVFSRSISWPRWPEISRHRRCWPWSACRWRWPPPSIPPTCSPRPRPGTSGRARS